MSKKEQKKYISTFPRIKCHFLKFLHLLVFDYTKHHAASIEHDGG